MKNQDMPASPIFSNEAKPCMVVDRDSIRKIEKPAVGESKYEKAFWMMFSSLASAFPSSEIDEIAKGAIEATDAGFKALEVKI